MCFTFRIVFNGQIRWLLPREESDQNGTRRHKEAGRGASGRAHRRLEFPRGRRVQRGDRLPGSRPVRNAAVCPSDDGVRSGAHVDAGTPGARGGSLVDLRRQGAARRQGPRERSRREKRHEQLSTLGQGRREQAGAREGGVRAVDDGGDPHSGRRRGVLLRRHRQPDGGSLRLPAAEGLEKRDVLLRAKVGRRRVARPRTKRGLSADEGGHPLVRVDALFAVHLRAAVQDALRLKSRKRRQILRLEWNHRGSSGSSAWRCDVIKTFRHCSLSNFSDLINCASKCCRGTRATFLYGSWIQMTRVSSKTVMYNRD